MQTKLAETTQLIEQRIKQLCDTMIDKYTNRYQGNDLVFEVVKGTKYYKIIEQIRSASALGGGHTSVHAFVGRQTGSVYKPASWKAPSKHVRYNLLDDASFETCLERCDWAGGYLYMA